MTPEQIRERAKLTSIQKKLAVRISKDGVNWNAQYFQHRDKFEDFMNRALHQGFTIEAITCAS